MMKVRTFSRFGMWLANRIPLWILPVGCITFIRKGKEIGLQIQIGKEK